LAALKTAQLISSKSEAEIICVTVIPLEVDWDRPSDLAKKKHTEWIEEFEEAEEVAPNHIQSSTPSNAPIR
jgi:hypothetical protein